MKVTHSMWCRTRDKGKLKETSTSDPPHGDVCPCQRQFTYIMSSDLRVDRYRVLKVTLLMALIVLYVHDTNNVEMNHRFFHFGLDIFLILCFGFSNDFDRWTTFRILWSSLLVGICRHIWNHHGPWTYPKFENILLSNIFNGCKGTSLHHGITGDVLPSNCRSCHWCSCSWHWCF